MIEQQGHVGLGEGECRELACNDGRQGFVVRYQGQLYAYRNSCPHTGAPLNWVPNQFLNHQGDLIQCALHGALFEISDGRCIHGPCVGASLDKIELDGC